MDNPDVARAPSGLQASLLRTLLYRVFHVLELGNLHIADLAANLLDAADVDRVDDVARIGIDRDLDPWVFPVLAFDRADGIVAVGRAAGLLQGLVAEVFEVVAADREEVGIAFELGV